MLARTAHGDVGQCRARIAAGRDLIGSCLGKGLLTILLGTLVGSLVKAEQNPSQPFRLGMTSDLFTEVNENDARAAMKVWILTAAEDHNLSVDPEPNIRDSIEELVELGLQQGIDGFGITTPSYPYLSRRLELGEFGAGVIGDDHTVTYLLLVSAQGRIRDLAQLEGASVAFAENPQMSLATIWLDVLLAQAGMRCGPDVLAALSTHRNPLQVVLPVFFGKNDVAVITRASYELIAELNPQLLVQLRILAESPPVVPVGFAFRRSFVSADQSRIMRAMENLGNSAAGRQILDMTRSDSIRGFPAEILDSSLQLLAERDRLCGDGYPRWGAP